MRWPIGPLTGNPGLLGTPSTWPSNFVRDPTHWPGFTTVSTPSDRDNLSSCTDRHRRGQGDVWVTHEVSELHSGISQVPNEWCPTNLETVMVPSLKFNESRGFTTVWWFDRGMKDIGGSRTLVSNWWLVNSFLDPQKLVDPEKWIGGSGIFVRGSTYLS